MYLGHFHDYIQRIYTKIPSHYATINLMVAKAKSQLSGRVSITNTLDMVIYFVQKF